MYFIFGKQCADSRERAGFTQERAIEEITKHYEVGISIRTLQNFESGKVLPNGEIVRAMMIAYKDIALGFEWLDQNPVYSIFYPKYKRETLLESVTKVGLSSEDAVNKRSEMTRAALDNTLENDNPEFIEKIKTLYHSTVAPWQGIIVKATAVGFGISTAGGFW